MLSALTPKAHERLRWLSCWQVLRAQGLTATQASQALEEELAQANKRLEELPREERRLVEGYRKGLYAEFMMRQEMGGYRTHMEKFYEVVDFPLETVTLNQTLTARRSTRNNTMRPH